MNTRSKNKENEENENEIYEVLPCGKRLSSWQYYNHPITTEMKKNILEKVKNTLDSIKLDGTERKLNIFVTFIPNDPYYMTSSVQGVLKRQRVEMLHNHNLTVL